MGATLEDKKKGKLGAHGKMSFTSTLFGEPEGGTEAQELGGQRKVAIRSE